MASSASAMPLGVGAIIGVTVAGCTALFVLILLATVVTLKRRYKLALAEIEQGRILPRSISDPLNAGLPPSASRTGKRQSQIKDLGWNRLSSNENMKATLHEEKEPNARSIRRTSFDALSWPLPGKAPNKPPLPLRILDEPQSGDSSLHTQAETHAFANATRELSDAAGLHVPLPQSMTGPSQNPPVQADPKEDTSRIKSPDEWTTNALRPRPLFTPRVIGAFDLRQPKADRSCSVPSILTSKSDNAMSCGNLRTTGMARHPRSFSLGAHQFPLPPADPLPPLPASNFFPDGYVHRRIQGRSLLRQSISSDGSEVSSVFNFGEAPMTELNSDGVGENAVPKWRDHQNRNDGPSEKTSIAGPRPLHRTLKTALSSESCSLHPSDITTSQRHPLGRARTPNNAVPDTEKDVNRLSIGEIHTAESVRMSKISNNSSQTDFISTIHVLNTPRRHNADMRRVSIHGSPRKKKKPSVLRDISGNESMPSRVLSQNSMITSISEDHNNPFVWESPAQQKRSILKTSPGFKTVRNRCSVRISSTPRVLGPPSSSTSSSKMDGIAEESSEKILRSCISRGDTTDVKPPLRPPSTSIFAPELSNKTTSLRASLTPSSPTLSFVPYHQENDVSAALDFGAEHHDRSSPNALPTLSSPYGSNNVPLPPSELPLEDGTDPRSLSTQFQSREPKTPPIPGLTLLDQGAYTKQELRYPTIEIFHSPGEQEQASNVSSPFQAYPTPPSVPENESSSAAAFFTNLSPSSKAIATTQVTQTEIEHVSRIRPTPLSSIVHPLNTKPYLAPPHNRTSAALNRPHGPRASPAQPIMKSIRGLRRENSDAGAFKEDSRGTRRYLGLGREPSPNLSHSNMLSVEEDEEESGKARISSVWDDGEEFWGPYQNGPGSREHGLGKNLGWEDENGLRIFVPEVSQGLYDGSGFLKV